MRATLRGVKIRGVCATVPDHVCKFEEELKYFPFPEKSSRRLGRVMGFREHRITDPATTPCDLASYTLNHLFHEGYLSKDSLESLLVVAQMADHPIPGNSKVIHGQLGLSKETYCADLYENCIGFISGLYMASCQIASGAASRVAIVTTDGAGCYANKLDRNTYPLSGDGAAVVIVEKGAPEDAIHFLFRNDGSRRDALIVPAGGCRLPSSAETAKVVMDEMGNYRSQNDMHMDGTAVFQFVMESVPPLIHDIYEYAGLSESDIDWHLTHQPNRFMLEKLADLLGVSRDKLFNNIVENFGNSSCVTIPLNIAFNLGARLLHEKFKVCLSAFGAGLSLGAAICELGDLEFCELIEHPGGGAIDETPANQSNP